MLQLLYKLFPYYDELDQDVKFNLRVDALASLIFGIFSGAVYPFTSVIALRLGASNFLIGFVNTAPFIGQLFAIYWGHRSAHSPRKIPMIVWIGLIARLMIIPLAFVTSPALFVFLVVFHNLVATFSVPAFNALMKKIYPDQYRGRLMGISRFLPGIAYVGATYLAGWWIDMVGYKSLFIVAGIVGVISILVYTRMREEASVIASKNVPTFSLSKVVNILKRDRAMAFATLGFVIFGFGNLFANPAYPIYQVKVSGLSYTEIGLLSVFNMPVWFLSYIFWGWVNDRTRSMVNIYIGITMYGLAPLIYLCHPSLPMMILASCLQGAAGASQDVGYINLLIKLGGEDADHYMGIYGTFLGLRGMLAPVLGSLLLDKIGFTGIFIVAASLIYLGLIPMSMVERQMGKLSRKTVEG